jgi:von Willebrand factor type A domain
MSRHAHDDFSFLPTVDSTDEEIVEKSRLVASQTNPLPQEFAEPEYAVLQDPRSLEESSYEAAAHPEPVYEEPFYEEPVFESQVHELEEVSPPEPPVYFEAPHVEEPVPVFAQAAEPLAPQEEAVSLAVPQEPEPPAAKVQPLQQSAALSNPESKGTLLIPRAPKAARVSKEPESQPPAVVAAPVLPSSDAAPSDEAKSDTAAPPDKDAKPFIAPKPAPEEPLDPDEAKKLYWQKLAEKVGLRTLGMSVGAHLFLLLIATFIGVSQMTNSQVDFLPGGSSAQSQAASEALTHKVQNKKNPWLKAKPVQRKITVQSLSANVVLPDMPPMDMMDLSKITSRMDLSKAPSMGSSQPMGLGGAGGGFGAGIGRGGKFNFVGQTATGRRVVFVVDVSGSMSQRLKGENQQMSRFDLLKKELIKAVKQLPMGTAYQVIYFSDFAWPHNEVDSRNSSAMEKFRWEVTSQDYKQVKIPTFNYIQATPFSIQDSVNIIQGSENPGGTNWGSGLLMALNANPKPDVIFFMTDGNRTDEMGWIDVVNAENKRKLPMAAIHTSVMAQTDAAREMDALARSNNGTFTVINDEGKVIKGQDFFKMQ